MRSYLLEQRHYALENGLLLYRFNQDTANEVHLAADIVDFQVQAILDDGTVLDTLDATTAWNTVRAIDVTIAATGTVEGRSMTRSVSARFFPRNVLSH